MKKLIKSNLFNQIIKSFSQKTSSSQKLFTEFQCKQMISQHNKLREILLQQLNKYEQMKIQQYWKLSLTHQQFGYYQTKNVFSKEGDFTTSPQISPLFGEMIAVWITYFLEKSKIFVNNVVEKKFRIVELGPGRGILMKTVLQCLYQMKVNNHFQLNFIEVSDYNRKVQQQNIIDIFKRKQQYFKFEFQKSTKQVEKFTSEDEFKEVNMAWFRSLDDMIRDDFENKKKNIESPFTIFLANEFFDALPLTILEYTQSGWKQKVITKSKSPHLFFDLVTSKQNLSPKLTPIMKNPSIGDKIEVSPQSLVTIDMIAKIINKSGGCILNIDYGGRRFFSDSIRAIKDHKYIPSPYFWQVPGLCDLSAYVDFGTLAQFAQMNEGIKAFDILPQGYFLQSMGINPRIQILLKKANQQQKNILQSQYKRLVDPSEMGQIYKVQIITKKQYGEIYPHIDDNPNVF